MSLKKQLNCLGTIVHQQQTSANSAMTMMVTMMMVMVMMMMMMMMMMKMIKMIKMNMRATMMMTTTTMMMMRTMMMVVLYDCDAGHDGDYQNGDGCRFLSLQIRSNIPVSNWYSRGICFEIICHEALYSYVQQGQHPSPSHGLNKSINWPFQTFSNYIELHPFNNRNFIKTIFTKLTPPED